MTLLNRSVFTLFTLSSLLFLAVTSSCKKSGSSSTAASGQLSATIGANSFKATAAAGAYSQSAGLFELVGSTVASGDTTAVVLYFYTPTQANLPVSSDTAYIDIQYADSKLNASYDGGQIAGHSIITVTSWDSIHLQIAGTFSGVLYNTNGGSDSLIIANGQFNMTYEVTP